MFRFDDSNPLALVAYTGDEHAEPQDYINFVNHWMARIELPGRFGVILVTEPHEHHEGDEEEHREHEAEISRIINDFRRDYRDKTAQVNLGFVRVLSEELVQQYFAHDPEAWERGKEQNDRFAQYNWGIPGYTCHTTEEALSWLTEQSHRQPTITMQEAAEAAPVAKTVGMFYGSSTGITEYVADDLAETWAQTGMEPVTPVNIGKIKHLSELLTFDCLILGIPTWNIGQLQDDWDIMFSQLDELDFSGKKVAIFGIGDQYGYPDNFIDAVGILGNKLVERGAELVGRWFDENYKFKKSVAFVDGKFMGLAIDDTNQPRLSPDRLTRWTAQLIAEFALQPVSAGAEKV